MTIPRAPATPTAAAAQDELRAVVQQLVGAGQHEEAAALAEANGLLEVALPIYEKLWRFDKALRLAESLEDWPRAVRLALEARLPDRAKGLADRVRADDGQVLINVAHAFAGRGQFEAAAGLAQRAGELRLAADFFRRAGLPLAAADALVAAGSLRDAARLLETVVATAGVQGAAAEERAKAELALGKLLSRLGRPWDAARVLQSCAGYALTRPEAQRYLCGVLLHLGLRYAAEEVARRLHQENPELPNDARQLAASVPMDAREVPERFTIERLLGAGGVGRVYLAMDRLLGRPVALKVLAVGAPGAEEQALARFVREAEAAGRLHHPHIVALHDVDLSAGLLVFEYVSGGSLAQRLSACHVLSLAQVRRLGLDLLDALGAAHEAGIVHRDVKPANVFLDAAGGAKLGDFGAAHLLDFGQTQTGGLIGTLAYLSPEQVTGARIGPAADLYALAATLFEALTGRAPFVGPDFVTQHLSEMPPSPSALAGLKGPAAQLVDRVLLRGLAKAAEERYRSTREMAEELAMWPVQDALATLAPPSVIASASQAPEQPQHMSPTILRTLGRTAQGTLLLQEDPHTERPVVTWRPDEVLAGPALHEWQQLAAQGGPLVQRVLSLCDNEGRLGKQVTLEHLNGDVVAMQHLPPQQHQALQAALATLRALTPNGRETYEIVDTPTGPVILLQPPLLSTDGD